MSMSEIEREEFRELMDKYREARDWEDDYASQASALAEEIKDLFGVDPEANR